uniref:G-protein coupled receptors family 1 profile domain-containing protein n=1 Tax=Biomphalaria glabrata TaxID=6526 RepID=A0A2C9LZE3_BIOGL
MAITIDREAMMITSKVFLIIFIIAILIINGLLLAKHVRKTYFWNSPKNLTFISMAIGDIFLALFPLVVEAKFIFDFDMSMADNCSLNLAYESYMYHLIHFVYGVSLVLLNVEILFRLRLQYFVFLKKYLVPVLGSCIPWFLGLIIVLPLCLSHTYRCKTWYTVETFSVTVIVPACLALTTSCVSFFLKCHKDKASAVKSNPDVNLTQAPDNRPNVYSKSQTSTTVQLSQEQQIFIETGQQPEQKDSSLDRKQQQQLFLDREEPHHPILIQATQPQKLSRRQNKNPVYTSQANPKKEQLRILIVSIVFFFMVIPFAALKIYLHFSYIDDRDTYILLYRIFYWMMLSRSFLTPIIFLVFKVKK